MKTVEMVPVAAKVAQGRPSSRVADLYEDLAGVGPDAMTRSYRAVAALGE